MKTYGGWKYSSTILDLDIRWRLVVTVTPRGKSPLVPIGYEAGCVPKPIWTL
jgi:hypothetical protein